MKRLFASLWLAGLLAGCSLTPPVRLYQPQLAPQFAEGGASTQEPVAQFWRRFGDPQLDALVAAALGANADLRIAAANLEEARALARYAGAQSMPDINMSASATRSRTRVFRGAPSIVANNFGASFIPTWETDLFGGIRAEARASVADALAREAQLRAVRVSVAAEVANNYFTLRGLQEQLRVAEASLVSQRETSRLVHARLAAGRSTSFDADRADAQVQTTAASVPAFEAQLARTRYRLAVLTGQPPTALDKRLAQPQPLPGLPPTALDQIGSPQSLLRRRPDVAAAELQAAAAAERVGVARSDLFPQLTLGGTLGLNASSVGDITTRDALAWNFGASLIWSLVDFGRRRALVAAASARGDAAMATYEKTVLGALEETEGAFAAYTRAQRRNDSLRAAARSAAAAAYLARVRFTAGTSDLLAVLDAERESLTARDLLAQSSTESATSLVAVYKALAGGW